jgi:hypothetical protein
MRNHKVQTGEEGCQVCIPQGFLPYMCSSTQEHPLDSIRKASRVSFAQEHSKDMPSCWFIAMDSGKDTDEAILE